MEDSPAPASMSVDTLARLEKIRDRLTLLAEAQRRADADPDDEVAADAADDLLDAIADNAILDVPFLLDQVDLLFVMSIPMSERVAAVADLVAELRRLRALVAGMDADQ